jgi:nucleoside-diphosphate-sugar epimerase
VAVVVTGSAGFIGRALVCALLDAGEHVVGIDREPRRPSLAAAGPSALPPAKVEQVTADLLDADDRIAEALSTADLVYHLAGCPGVRDSGPDVRRRRHRDNVLATARVLRAVPPGTPLVVASSSSVYGGSASGRPCAESDPLRPRGGYARSKVTVEALCRARQAVGGRTTVVRPFTVAGEGQRSDMALAQWIAAAREGRPLRLLGSPDRTRDITDVREVVRALVALGFAGHERGGGPATVNVGTGVGHTLRAMAAAVAAAVGRPVTCRVLPAGPAEVSDTLADTRLLRRLVGFVPQTDLVALVRRQADAATGTGTTRRRPVLEAVS